MIMSQMAIISDDMSSPKMKKKNKKIDVEDTIAMENL